VNRSTVLIGKDSIKTKKPKDIPVAINIAEERLNEYIDRIGANLIGSEVELE
jgi:hypothetical protein